MSHFASRIAEINREFGLDNDQKNDCDSYAHDVFNKSGWDVVVLEDGVTVNEEEDWVAENSMFASLHEAEAHLEAEFINAYEFEASRIQYHNV